GHQDVLLGTAWGGRTAYAVDGVTGDVLWKFDTYSDSPSAPETTGSISTS
ncbi:MAG: PQQ-binding-like beta-propeller repeat protein, partial [Candidatus Eisenbacteria bacterium]|nr:PQQ-binding-like beta-propeller repeat protein [Candidatus Eisenbacteria bacterium]